MTNSDSSNKWIGYVRVSTTEQSDSGLGIAAQRKAIESYVESIGGTLVAVVEDSGQSGATLDRTGLRDALQRLLDGEASGLIASKLDRISRSTADVADLLEWSEQTGVTIAALDVGLDTQQRVRQARRVSHGGCRVVGARDNRPANQRRTSGQVCQGRGS